MDFTNILTDEQGEYVLDQYGSKHRRAGANSWTLAEADMSQEHKDALAAEAAAQQAIEDAAAQKEAIRIATLHGWDNQYILMARSLGLPDKATTQEIQAKLSADKATCVANGDLAGALDVVEQACAFLAIINAITQSGGNHAGITWHDDV